MLRGNLDEAVLGDSVARIRIGADWPLTPSLQTTRSYAARPRDVMRLSAFDAIFASAI